MNVEDVSYNSSEDSFIDTSLYPEVDGNTFFAMLSSFYEEDQHEKVFIITRSHKDIRFIDIYVFSMFNTDLGYDRFVIREGLQMKEAEERRFFNYTKSDSLICDEAMMRKVKEDIDRDHPELQYLSYGKYGIGKAMQHLYYASHRSGPREILYKAHLQNIAFNLEQIHYNKEGINPESIIGHGLPLKLLRILNQTEFIHYLYSLDNILLCRDVYMEYSNYIGTKLPSLGQWLYLIDLYEDQGMTEGWIFNRGVYNKLQYSAMKERVDLYKSFFLLRYELSNEKRFFNLPDLGSVQETVMKMEKFRYYLENPDGLDRLFRNRKAKQFYEFNGNDYGFSFSVTLPESTYDLCIEALEQRNCLMNYVEQHAYAETTIMFIRNTHEMQKTYVTMEIKEGQIWQVYGKFNRVPDDRSVFEFLEEYAKQKWLRYDPKSLIPSDNIVAEPVREYLNDYLKRIRFTRCEEEEGKAETTQLSLVEYYPEVFRT